MHGCGQMGHGSQPCFDSGNAAKLVIGHAIVMPNVSLPAWPSKLSPEAEGLAEPFIQTEAQYYVASLNGYSPLFGLCRHPCGIIGNTALWALCRYRHKAHWSGGTSRLNRDLTDRFGSADRAQEELRAELASVFIGATLGLPCDIPNHASYLASWAQNLKQDKREIFRAAADAQRIADYLLAFHPDYAEAGHAPGGEEGGAQPDVAEAA